MASEGNIRPPEPRLPLDGHALPDFGAVAFLAFGVQDLHYALRHDPQLARDKTIVEVEHPTAGTVEMLALPINFHATPAEYRRAPPRLGEHSVEILREFGFDKNEIDALIGVSAVAGMNP